MKLLWSWGPGSWTPGKSIMEKDCCFLLHLCLLVFHDLSSLTTCPGVLLRQRRWYYSFSMSCSRLKSYTWECFARKKSSERTTRRFFFALLFRSLLSERAGTKVILLWQQSHRKSLESGETQINRPMILSLPSLLPHISLMSSICVVLSTW